MSSSEMTKIATPEHCAYCFDMLIEELTNVPSEYDWTKLPLGHAKMYVVLSTYWSLYLLSAILRFEQQPH